MTNEQWIQLAAQGGAGLLVLAGILLAVKWWIVPMVVKVVAPMIVGAFDNLSTTIRDASSAQVEASKEQAAAVKEQAAAIGQLAERVAHMEGRLDHRDSAPVIPIAAGTGDAIPPVNVRPARGR